MLKERADELRAQLTAVDWRNQRTALDPIVEGLRDLAERDWYVAADVWRDSGTDAPLPDFIDPATDVALELRYQSAERGNHRELQETPATPVAQKIDKLAVGEAANEADAKKPANEPEKPVAEKLTDLDLAAVKAVRKTDRARAEAMLREVAQQARAATKGKEQAGPAQKDKEDAGGELVSKAGTKPIFKKTGYEIPQKVAVLYVAHEGKFVDRKTEQVHFEDKGRSLSTESNDRSVIAHMVEVAKAKNWGTLTLRGSEEFRRQGWLAAELAGVKTNGFRPKAQDRAMLEAARQEMRISAGERSAEKENSLDADDSKPGERTEKTPEPAPAVAPAAADNTSTKHRESIGIAAARMVLERQIANWPAATQDKCRREFDQVIASAAAYKDRKVDLPAPKVSEKAMAQRRSAQRPDVEKSKSRTHAQPAHQPSRAPERAAAEPGIEMDR
ncbi:LPD7 domain-containing protein [Ralstonia psammae]|uniref:LPD7 domain-containing protein n=1 Tax=Ralstonia psammae TaxID=3058598 RepID=UPI0029313F2F|nr:LPD7 domain-containing protein [Ralstonia sp. LMG 19083]